MITKVDDTLKVYLLNELGNPDNTILDVSFKLPTKNWLKSNGSIGDNQSSDNWINIYLLEIRENLERRRAQWHKSYQSDKVKQNKPPFYVDLYYMISLYNKNKNSTIEHQYLESVLMALSDFSNLAPKHINDKDLLGQMSMELFPKPYIDDQLSLQVWTALGQDARPYIPLKITVALTSKVSKDESIVTSKTLNYLHLDEVTYSLQGQVISKSQIITAGNTKEVVTPVMMATVNLENEEGDTIQTKTTDNLGKFEFRQVVNEELKTSVIAEGYEPISIDLNDLSNSTNRSITIVMKKV